MTCRYFRDWEPEDLCVYAVYPDSTHLPSKLRSFIDFLVERLGSEPYWDFETRAAGQ